MGRPHRHSIRWALLWSTGALTFAPLHASAGDSPPAPSSGVLVVEVLGIPSSGTLYLELYDAQRQERWGEPLRRERRAVDEGRPTQWRVDGLPQGDYAVRVFLDQNGNGSLDRSRSGVPTEPFGFSNDAQPRYGIPRLKVAAFRFASPEQRIAIQLKARKDGSAQPGEAPASEAR